MSYLKIAFEELSNEGYFETNTRLYLNTSNKIHRNMLDSLFLCENNYRKFLKAYLNIKENVSKDKTLRTSLREYCQQLFTNNYAEEDRISNNCRIVLLVLSFSLLYENGNLLFEDMRIPIKNSKLFNELFNPRMKESKLVRLFNELLDYDDESLKRAIDINWVIWFNYPIFIGVIYPELLCDEVLDSALKNSVSNLLDEVKNEKTLKAIKKLGVGRYKLSLFCSTNCVKFSDLNNYKEIERIGFLKDDRRRGSIYYEEQLLLNYQITEIVKKEGVIINYTVWDKNFQVIITEDTINKIVSLRQLFIDGSFNKQIDNVLAVGYAYMSIVRKHYQGLIIDKESISKHIKNYTNKHNYNYADSEYFKEEIWIAPYKRRNKLGDWASDETIDRAKKLGFILEKGETFVDRFTRNQRYKKER